jgi:nicotinate-nucleotide pyrophosphorylase (carboxylating)
MTHFAAFFQEKYQREIDLLITHALAEDLGPGDFSSLSCLSNDKISKAQLLVKEDCVLAGVAMAVRICELYDASLEVNMFCVDGDHVCKGTICLEIH